MTREEAIDVLKANFPASCFELLGDAVYMAIEALQEQERKKGKWLKPTGLSNPICSECHSCPNLLFGLTSKYCPNCGAEMEEQDG